MRRRAGSREDAAPVRVVPEQRRLDAARRRSGSNRACLSTVDGAADLDLGQDGRALAVCDDLLRQLLAYVAEREREGGVGGRIGFIVLNVGEQADGVVRRALAVDRDRVVAALDRRSQELDRLARLERIGAGTASIVASCGWIIPEPFAIPPTVNPSSVTAAPSFLVGGQDRRGRIPPAGGR